MKVQMRMVDILVRLKCPECGTIRDLNYFPVTLPDMKCECLDCRDRDLEELYSPGEKPPEKNRPFQNCFEDCPINKPKLDWGKISKMADKALALINEIEKEVERSKK